MAGRVTISVSSGLPPASLLLPPRPSRRPATLFPVRVSLDTAPTRSSMLAANVSPPARPPIPVPVARLTVTAAGLPATATGVP